MNDRTLFPMVSENDRCLPFIVMSVGVRGDQEHIVRSEGYPCYHWLHCSNGSGILLVDGKEFNIGTDMGFFLSPGVPHEYFALKEPWETHWITFEGYAIPSLLKLLGFERWNVFHITGRQLLEKLLLEIYAAGVSKSIAKTLECSALLYQFLLTTRHRIEKNSDLSNSSTLLQLHPVILYMEENFSSQISLDELALKANVSKQHFCRLFKQTHHMRPFEYLNRYRIQKAKEYMVVPKDPPVKAVAEMVGFNDTSYFCAVFKEYEGVTPLEFKRIYRIPSYS
jgi:AraC family transcriptional regulator of arabinose operon